MLLNNFKVKLLWRMRRPEGRKSKACSRKQRGPAFCHVRVAVMYTFIAKGRALRFLFTRLLKSSV